MNTPVSNVQAEIDGPILFRTTGAEVYQKTLEKGSLWLRSDEYFRNLEDTVRNDRSEGVNGGRVVIPLMFKREGGPQVQIQGDGQIGRIIVPHYILSLHGSSISAEQHAAFGGWTFGLRILSKLAAEVLYRVSLQIKCNGYRFGQVIYQYAALSQSHSSQGGDALRIDGKPSTFLNPLNTDVLRKQPLTPFIEQDEWRIVIFTDAYIDDDPDAPLVIKVSSSHFYPYLNPG